MGRLVHNAAIVQTKSVNKETNALTREAMTREERAKLTAWLSTQRGKRQYRHAPPAARAVQKIIKPLSNRHGAGVSVISENWLEIAGTRFAKFSRPVKITGGRDGRTLHIQAPGAAAALIMAGSGQILDRLNTFLGHSHISRIKVSQSAMKTAVKAAPRPEPRGLTPSQDSALQSGLSKIKDPALKQALDGLGRKALSQK